MKRLLTLATVIILCLCQFSLIGIAATEADDYNPVAEAKQAVVYIASGIYFDANGNVNMYTDEYFTGTGFGVAGEGGFASTFVTNAHVVTDENGELYPHVYICIDGADLRDESTLVKCEVIYSDAAVDVAIIQASKPIEGVTILQLAAAESIEVGEDIFALGYPGIADEAADSNDFTVADITVTDGVISRHLTSEGVECMAHTAMTNHGNSGGPLINKKAQVVGINTFSIIDNETSDKRSYSIYIDYAMKALGKLGIAYNTADEKAEDETDNKKLITDIAIYAAAALLVAVIAIVLKKALTKNKGGKTTPVIDSPSVIDTPVADEDVLYYIKALDGPVKGISQPLKKAVTIGRNVSCDIVLPAETKGVSRLHCRIELRDDKIVLTDLSSAQGTYVNGKKIEPKTSVSVKENAEIALGSNKVVFTVKRK